MFTTFVTSLFKPAIGPATDQQHSHLPPDEALEKALSSEESAAALGNELLQGSFLKAAETPEDKGFQKKYFEGFEKSDRGTFRQRLRDAEVFESALLSRHTAEIEGQQKASKQPGVWEKKRMSPTVNQDARVFSRPTVNQDKCGTEKDRPCLCRGGLFSQSR